MCIRDRDVEALVECAGQGLLVGRGGADGAAALQALRIDPRGEARGQPGKAGEVAAVVMLEDLDVGASAVVGGPEQQALPRRDQITAADQRPWRLVGRGE